MKLKIIYILVSIFIIQQTVIAQNYSYSGRVINKNTKLPVSNVNIQILPNNRFGCITDENGEFHIQFGKNKLALKFSHVSFYTKIVQIDRKNISDSNLIISLSPKIYTLDEVTINEKKYETIYKTRNQSVIDYAVYKNRIFFIVKDFHNMKTLLFSVDMNLSDTTNLNTSVSPKALIIDFYNNLDMVSKKDSVYQLVNNNGKTKFLKPFHFKKLSKLLQLYKFKIDNKYYFSEFESKIQDKINFGFVNEDKKKKIFYSIYDTEKIDYYYDVLRFLGGLASSHSHLPPGEERREIVEKHYYSNDLTLDRLWFYNNISNIFFQLKEDIYIIDNLNNKLLKFDKNDNLYSKITIRYNTKTNNVNCQLLKNEGGRIWKNNIIIDSCDTTNVYLVWKDGIKTKLFVFNLFDGTISFVKTLPHIFPKKIAISKQKLYYLYEKPGNERNYGLYRTELY